MMHDNDNPFSDPSVSISEGESYEQLPSPGIGGFSNAATPTTEDWLESGPEQSEFSNFKEGPMESMEPLNPLDIESPAQENRTSGSSQNTASENFKKVANAVAEIRTAPLSKLIFYMRVANICVASLMVTSAILTLLADSSATLATLVICIYMSCFGCLLCCFEAHLKSVSATIADNFGFMYNAKGRFCFLVLLSTLCFSLDLIGKITGILLCLTACLNLYVIIKFPEYSQDTFEADRSETGNDSLQSLASNTLFGVAKENPDLMASAMATTAKFAYENPEVAKSAHDAWTTAAPPTTAV
mmetsp:Transcript_53641/g.68877  ORF Transcript_53641/g.68877 Transcript_53641/m.68877 type:complete len:300 (-) Transcript_53641:173-1072(-)